jgi:PAS domain S-box-containing protein
MTSGKRPSSSPLAGCGSTGGIPAEPSLHGPALDRFAGLTLDLLCVAGFDGRFRYLNPAWERTLGWTIAELCARPYVEFVHPDDRISTGGKAQGISTGEVVLSFRNRYLCKDGTYRWLLWNSMPDEREERIYAAARDITGEVRVESQKDELTALIVHDLKSPLASILVNAGYLAQPGVRPDEVQEVACDLRDAAESMQRLIVNLLDIARSEDGALVPILAELNLQGFLAGVCEAMRRRAEESSSKLRFSAASATQTLQADPDLLRRVLENLLDNSIRYAPPGSSIDVEARSLEDTIELRVRDQGAGVPPEQRDQIFKKYARGSDPPGSLTRTCRGLGLVFCRLAIEAHGGQIWVEDNHPEGSVFCIRLPSRSGASRDVYVHGTVDPSAGAQAAAADAVASRLLVLSAEQVLAFLSSPGPSCVRSNLSGPLAEKLVRVLREAGVRAVSRPFGQDPPEDAAFARRSESADRGGSDVSTQRIRTEFAGSLRDANPRGPGKPPRP